MAVFGVWRGLGASPFLADITPRDHDPARIVATIVAGACVGLVASVCDEIYVLDFGKLIYAGTAADALSSPVVQAAYLGTDDVTVPAGLGDEEPVES